MSLIVVVLSFLFTSSDDVEALRSTAPSYLTTETARSHLVAARYAASVHRVDADLLLSIAWFESRYDATARTAEPLGKTSCGVMTPVPKPKCVTPNLVNGYLEGAEHLRTWLDVANGNLNVAMLGFAGGYKMIKSCSEGKLMVQRGGRDVDLCTVVSARLHRMRWIQRARTKASNT